MTITAIPHSVDKLKSRHRKDRLSCAWLFVTTDGKTPIELRQYIAPKNTYMCFWINAKHFHIMASGSSSTAGPTELFQSILFDTVRLEVEGPKLMSGISGIHSSIKAIADYIGLEGHVISVFP